MSYFTVTRTAGPAWTEGGITAQPGIADHAAFMNALADEGFVLLAGPLAGTEQGRLRALLIVNAESEPEIHRRLADDPWTLAQLGEQFGVSLERIRQLQGQALATLGKHPLAQSLAGREARVARPEEAG